MNTTYYLHTKNNLQYLQFPILDTYNWLICAFSTRNGGISKGKYDNLNLGLHVGDLEENVLENRNRFCEALDIKSNQIVLAEQIHNNNIIEISSSHIGKGALKYEDALKGIDGMISNTSGIVIGIGVADCVPLWIIDIEKRVIGMAHAGWRGTLLNIAKSLFEIMSLRYNINSENCLAIIGPAIRDCCYAVGEEIINKFNNLSIPSKFWRIKDKSSYWLDLQGINYHQLNQFISKQNISLIPLCTSCNKDLFYSYRRDNGKTGRMLGILGLR